MIFALMIPAMTASGTTAEQESVCDQSVYYDENLYISIAQIHEQLVSLSWPELSPIMRQARMEAQVVFQIKVSPSGIVCSVEFIGGNRLILEPLLTPEIKKWKFRPDRPFWGLIAIRYVSGRGFRLL